MSSKLIDTIALPAGLRTLGIEELVKVASELRDEMIDCVSRSGGHFASSLGATEITVALHHIFNTPLDKIIWDVGHQAYIHKMVTGRRDQMGTIKQFHGLSGFLKRSESEFDAFGAGHAGTSISAAVGMRVALDTFDPERYVVAVIGDGSMTSGMAFEALNHAGDLGLKRLIVLLNDNEMSISPNVGALSWMFSRAITSKTPSRARRRIKDLYQQGYVPELIYKTLDRAEEATQAFLSNPATLFEGFGFRYIGPIDGHNIEELTRALENAKDQDVPVLVHAYTTKGKGYGPAEEDPITWHGVVPFDRSRGEFLASASKKAPSYTSVFANAFIEIAKQDPKIVAITAAMLGGTGLDVVKEVLPKQVFDVGICEQHAVTFAAGLACEGIKPITAIYSTFLQRAYDQIIHDVCIQNLPVVFAIDRGGVVGNDGETHQGVFDIAYLRTVPNLVIMSPRDEGELRHMLLTAVQHNGPIALRYPRGNGIGANLEEPMTPLEIGKAEVLTRGQDVLLIAFGPVVSYATSAAEILQADHGISCTVINARFAKPLDGELLLKELPCHELVCTVEDHACTGGFGSGILEYINDFQIKLRNPIIRFGIDDHFVAHATQSEQHAASGYDTKGIVARVITLLHPKQLVA